MGEPSPGEGIEALRRSKPQRAQLLARGPGAFGFAGEIWTLPRVAQVIEQEVGVSYHPTQVGRILKDRGWSWQQPALRAAQREGRHPQLAGTALRRTQNKAVAEGRTIRWADASGFYPASSAGQALRPALLRTGAPVAQTPVIRRQLSREHLIAISMSGELCLAMPDHPYKGRTSSGSWSSCWRRYRGSCW